MELQDLNTVIQLAAGANLGPLVIPSSIIQKNKVDSYRDLKIEIIKDYRDFLLENLESESLEEIENDFQNTMGKIRFAYDGIYKNKPISRRSWINLFRIIGILISVICILILIGIAFNPKVEISTNIAINLLLFCYLTLPVISLLIFFIVKINRKLQRDMVMDMIDNELRAGSANLHSRDKWGFCLKAA